MSIEDTNSSVTISTTNAGFPPYMDFNKLRSEGIAYLGQLAGQLWTDHNVHDPGITILEELCYALLDLGYRTNLPVEDILSKNPTDKTRDNNFFTPAQILSCNPLTITDYRKLLIDIPGVRNAWLRPADDITNICTEGDVIGKNKPGDILKKAGKKEVSVNNNCKEFLNGIYHVYVETDLDVDTDFKNDDPAQEDADKKAFIKDITGKVREALMSHRNLCEDFADIYILCKLDVGVCASIEVEDGADPGNVYVAVANRLHDFFTNVPKFYTLQQMLDMGKSMEDIFAGRPYSSQSHGFIDTKELEAIELKKGIHTSDIYNAIFEVAGVKKISSLRFRTCGDTCETGRPEKNTYWKFLLPENHIPVYSITCSGFEFTRNGRLISVDQSQFDSQLDLGWLHNGKVLYSLPSAYLDAEVPKGIYHDDLDSYYSIQNDFPVVYGIGEGDLSNSVSDLRKAQALQLKGYLFFFDQMLANYLSQLKNIRQLFSFIHPIDLKSQHTYFLNTISTVPELNKLLRFGTGESDNGLGTSGTLLAFPVSKIDWQLIDTAQLLAQSIIDSQVSFEFNSLFALYESTDLLRNDLVNDGETTVKTYSTADGYYLYTIESSTDDFILLSKKISTSQADALRHAASVQYAGVFDNNYRSFLTSSNQFTFDIELNIDTYTEYLGILVESDELYTSRRKDFLSHLLSRFAESFTDFVLLNWNPGRENDALRIVENYLTSFPDLSRNRGKAYDYIVAECNATNTSGYERKVKALAGIPIGKWDHLCPFTVEPYDESYILDFSATGVTAFVVNERFDLMEDALKAASALIASMADQNKYTIKYIGEKKEYQLLLDYGSAAPAVYHSSFTDSNTVEGLVTYLSKSFSQEPAPGSVYESGWSWVVRINNNAGEVIRVSEEHWTAESEAATAALKLAGKLNDNKKWKSQKDHPFHGKLFYDPVLKNNYRFIDISPFYIDVNDTIIGKPGKYSYDVVDKGVNTIKLSALIDFDTKEQAEAHCQRILVAATDKNNYKIDQGDKGNVNRLEILLDGTAQAMSAVEYATKEDAQNAVNTLFNIIGQHIFSLDLLKTPIYWKFKYLLGYEEGNSFVFDSDQEYPSEKAGLEAAQLFYKHAGELAVKENKNHVTLWPQKNKTVSPVTYMTSTTADAGRIIVAAKQSMEEQHTISRLHEARKRESLKSFVKVDGVAQFGTFVYRLVNKNNVPAVYMESYADIATAQNNRKAIVALSKKAILSIPGICLGGDIVDTILDASQTIWYRYQIMFYNVQGIPGNQLVLFESVNAFPEPDIAVQDFYNNYLQVLMYASDKANYGKFISSTPVDISSNSHAAPNDLIAFIPGASLKILQDSFGALWNDKLVEIVQLYPIKVIDSNSIKFAELFCTDYKNPVTDCAAGEKNWKYYFSIPVPDSSKQPIVNAGWISTAYYDNPDLAMEDYRNTRRLFWFTGNYFIDCACSKTVVDEGNQTTTYSYSIFLHEVLAQGIDWFQTENDAWGPLGIEKFICAVQNGQAIHNYQRRDDCCYSFYVTCGNGLLEHPCKYDTEQQRDLALNNLYARVGDFLNKGAYGCVINNSLVTMNDSNGDAFAQVNFDAANQKNTCEWMIQLEEDIFAKNGTTSYEADGFLRFTIGSSGVVIQSTRQKINLDKKSQDEWTAEWEKMLWYWSCYFPISRTRLNNVNANARGNIIQYKYCIEIKLPGFNLCDEDATPYQPCMPIVSEGSGVNCNIAWKGACCYSNCTEAMNALEQAKKLLQDRNNYHSTFDCDCHSFGIALHTIQPSLVGLQAPPPADSDIIAVNPQCYENDKQVCEAAGTALQLINSQGMHLVEHILLRPETEADCECRLILNDCTTDCKFPDFIIKGADGCEDADKSICFRPGTDPYSFIATVVLPAWSDRFRTETGRLLLENILYREAPAHVLLRILWLKPKDFCLFEKEFEGWRKWLAGLNACNTDFNICQFLDLLFHTPYDCLEDCTLCLPCTDPGNVPPINCLEEDLLLRKKGGQLSPVDIPFAFLNQVNETYCFDGYCESNLDNGLVLKKDIKEGIVEKKKDHQAKTIAADKKIKTIAEVPVIKKTADNVSKPGVKDRQTPAPQSGTDLQQKAKTVNARFRKYKTTVAETIEHSGNNTLAIKTDRFISAHQADAVKLETLVKEITGNEKSELKGTKKLTKAQQLHLISAAICFYLDKISFNGKDESAYNQLKPSIALVKKAGLDVSNVFSYWTEEEVAKVEPGTDISFVKKLITGSKK